jgi:hypothetical protein
MSSPRTRLLPLLAALLAACALAPVVLANGDPASDVLLTLPVFYPYEAEVSEEARRELEQVLEAAKEAGFEVRVAVIATPVDLGLVTSLYRKPKQYANFLGQEIRYVYPGYLLVVMPNGYGVYQPDKPLTKDNALVADIPPPGSADGNALVVGAANAVRVLAGERGLTLKTGGGSGSDAGDRVQIVIALSIVSAAALAIRALQRRRERGEPDAP